MVLCFGEADKDTDRKWEQQTQTSMQEWYMFDNDDSKASRWALVRDLTITTWPTFSGSWVMTFPNQKSPCKLASCGKISEIYVRNLEQINLLVGTACIYTGGCTRPRRQPPSGIYGLPPSPFEKAWRPLWCKFCVWVSSRTTDYSCLQPLSSCRLSSLNPSPKQNKSNSNQINNPNQSITLCQTWCFQASGNSEKSSVGTYRKHKTLSNYTINSKKAQVLRITPGCNFKVLITDMVIFHRDKRDKIQITQYWKRRDAMVLYQWDQRNLCCQNVASH